MSVRRGALEQDLRSAGLVVRRRDLLRVACAWSLSNGALSRSLGRYGFLLLPASGPVHLVMAAVVRRSLLRRGRACVSVRGPHGGPGLDLLALLLIALPVCLLVWVPIASLPLLLPRPLALTVFWVPTGFLLLALPDVAGPVAMARLRQMWRGLPSVTGAAAAADAAAVAALAAYPRGYGHGRRLMEALNRHLDDRGLPAYLDARTPGLVPWYESLGYVRVGDLRMRREPVRPANRTDGESAEPPHEAPTCS